MDEATEKKALLVSMHDLWYLSAAWMRAVTAPQLVGCLASLLGPDVELHHSTMHVKPPETGHPFPMHQDNAFYEHHDERFVAVLIHLDDTDASNGEIRFMDGSHKMGALEHVRRPQAGEPCTPHLPTDRYRLEQTVPVPVRAGDVVCFDIFTIHGSFINTTPQDRRMVRVGYRHPENRQLLGQSFGRPGWMVAGKRTRQPRDELFANK